MGNTPLNQRSALEIRLCVAQDKRPRLAANSSVSAAHSTVIEALSRRRSALEQEGWPLSPRGGLQEQDYVSSLEQAFPMAAIDLHAPDELQDAELAMQLLIFAGTNGGTFLMANGEQAEHVLWSCAESHKWWTALASPATGRWCPRCKSLSPRQGASETQPTLPYAVLRSYLSRVDAGDDAIVRLQALARQRGIRRRFENLRESREHTDRRVVVRALLGWTRWVEARKAARRQAGRAILGKGGNSANVLEELPIDLIIEIVLPAAKKQISRDRQAVSDALSAAQTTTSDADELAGLAEQLRALDDLLRDVNEAGHVCAAAQQKLDVVHAVEQLAIERRRGEQSSGGAAAGADRNDHETVGSGISGIDDAANAQTVGEATDEATDDQGKACKVAVAAAQAIVSRIERGLKAQALVRGKMRKGRNMLLAEKNAAETKLREAMRSTANLTFDLDFDETNKAAGDFERGFSDDMAAALNVPRDAVGVDRLTSGSVIAHFALSNGPPGAEALDRVASSGATPLFHALATNLGVEVATKGGFTVTKRSDPAEVAAARAHLESINSQLDELVAEPELQTANSASTPASKLQTVKLLATPQIPVEPARMITPGLQTSHQTRLTPEARMSVEPIVQPVELEASPAPSSVSSGAKPSLAEDAALWQTPQVSILAPARKAATDPGAAEAQAGRYQEAETKLDQIRGGGAAHTAPRRPRRKSVANLVEQFEEMDQSKTMPPAFRRGRHRGGLVDVFSPAAQAERRLRAVSLIRDMWRARCERAQERCLQEEAATLRIQAWRRGCLERRKRVAVVKYLRDCRRMRATPASLFQQPSAGFSTPGPCRATQRRDGSESKSCFVLPVFNSQSKGRNPAFGARLQELGQLGDLEKAFEDSSGGIGQFLGEDHRWTRGDSPQDDEFYSPRPVAVPQGNPRTLFSQWLDLYKPTGGT